MVIDSLQNFAIITDTLSKSCDLVESNEFITSTKYIVF